MAFWDYGFLLSGVMIPEEYLNALKEIVYRLQGIPIQWAVTGSLGMSLQGVPLDVHDIDIQTDRDGAYAMERLFVEQVVTPVRYVESDHIRSHPGIFMVGGIRVEVMGDV